VKLDLTGLDQFRASALLADPPPHDSVPQEMDLELIDFDPEQPRGSVDDAALAELAASIREKGVLEPVSLRRHPDRPGRFIVNRGERRVRASRLAGRRTVPWFLDERVDRYAQVIENLQREDLMPFDLARFIADRERDGDSRAEIARKLGKPRSFITEAAGLIDAPAEVRTAFEAGRASDTRVLYQLAKGVREKAAAVGPLLAGDAALTRDVVEAAMREPHNASAPEEASSSRRIEGSKLARALLVEHAGRRGRLGCKGQPGRRTAQVQFDDGSRQTVELSELKLVAWSAR
jgi:ParB family chromosome partitioning protein